MSKIEAEILKATKQKKKGSKEATQDYLTRLFDAVQALGDDGWDDLTEATQVWANECAKAKKKKKSFPDFPSDEAEEEDADEDEDEDADSSEDGDEDGDEDDDGEDEDEDSDEDEDEDEDDKKSSKKSSKKEDKKPAKKEEKSSKKSDKKEDKKSDKADKKSEKKDEAKAGGSGRKTGVTTHIKKIILKDPSITLEDLVAKLETMGLGPVSNMTASTVRADFRQSLAVMHEAGALSDALAKKMDKAKK